jgi:Tol biopolymer transport system component
LGALTSAVLAGAFHGVPEQELAYVRAARIHVLALPSKHDRVVAHGSAPAWSPDGSRLAFVDRGALWSADPHGRGRRRLTPRLRGDLSSPAWSPNGRALAFLRTRAERVELVTVQAGGGGLRRLLDKRGLEYPSSLEWLPSGELAFCAGDPAARWAVLARGGRPRRLGDEPQCGYEPLASPYPGLRLMRRLDSQGNGQIIVATPPGRTVRRLTNDVPLDPLTHLDNYGAVWSPDGARVAFLSERMHGRWGLPRADVFVVRTDGRGERRLTWNADATSLPAFSPDGTLLAFARHAAWSRNDLTVVGVHGGPPRWVGRGVRSAPTWRPQPPPRLAPRPRPSRVATRFVRIVRTNYFRGGLARLVHVRRFSSSAYELAEMSPDGGRISLAAYPYAGDFEFPVGYLDLRANRMRILVWGAAPREFAVGGEFSPDGRLLLFRRWRRLLAVDVETGRVSFVADDPAPGPVGWLSDGRVAFVDRRRRLMFVPLGGRPTPAGFRASDPPGVDDLGDFTWSPDGTEVLYSRGCRTWLFDLASRRHRRVGGRFTKPGPWSPDGRYFILGDGVWQGQSGCRGFWSVLDGGGTLYARGGRRLGALPLGYPTWSTDSRYLTFTDGVTGTAVAYEQPLSVLNLRTHRLAWIFHDRDYGPAFIGPGGWVVYGRYDRPSALSDEAPLVPARTYVARMLAR